MQVGVFLNQPDSEYFAINALGSTDLAKLCKSPADWWYGSRHNPNRVEIDNPAFAFGKALHALVLEGEEAFNNLVVKSPFDNFRTKDAQGWRDEQLAAGKAILTEDEIQSNYQMAALMLNHPELKGIQSGLTEVGVIWEKEGITFRAKIDSLLPNFSIDMKTYTGNNTQGRNPKDTALRAIAMRNYDVQRAHYQEAREVLIDFVNRGLVFGATEEQMEKLRFVASIKEWFWLWIFYQKIDNKTGKAPIVMPLASAPNDYAQETGSRKIKTAIANYKAYQERFGNEPWAQINPITKIESTEYVPWMGDVADPEFEDEAA